jgi:hypothetical protein
MLGPSSISIVFVAIAVIFVGVALRDYLKVEGMMTIAPIIWIRMAIIFAAVGIGLFFVQIFTLLEFGTRIYNEWIRLYPLIF